MHLDELARPAQLGSRRAPAHTLPTGSRGRRAPLELVVAAVVAVLASSAVQWVVNRLSVPHQSNVPTALIALAAFVLGIAALVVAWKPWSAGRAVWGWVPPAVITTVVQSLRLTGTKFYLFGTGGDQFFRMQYMQRLASSPKLADGNYVGIPPYYPAGWFWLGGRFADIRGEPAWLAYKPFCILTIAVTASVAFVLWSLVVRRKAAFVLAVLTAVAGVTIDPYEPYAWLIMTLVVPAAVLAWRLFGAVTHRRADSLGTATVAVGLVLGVAGAVYTLLFGLFVVLLVLLFAAGVVRARRPAWFSDELPPLTGRPFRLVARRLVLRLVLVGLTALPLVLLVWTPYLIGAVGNPTSGTNAANYLPRSGATLSAPMVEFSVSGALCLLGTVWIVVAWRRSSLAQGLALTVAGCYLWQVLSTLGLGLHTTLLSFNSKPPLVLALWCAAVFAAVDVSRLASERVSHRRGIQVRVVASILALVTLVQLAQTIPDSVKGLVKGAYTSYDAGGNTALDPSAKPDPDEPGSWNGRLIAAIGKVSGRAPDGNVLLTDDFQLLDFRPYWSFQTSAEPYANPMARYGARNRDIRAWTESRSYRQLVHRLDASEFTPPNVFVLRRDGTGLHIAVSRSDFPRSTRVRTDLTFRPGVFDGPQFRRVDVGPFAVIARHRAGQGGA